MNTMVIYDSLYGNTEKVAHAIGKAFSDASGATESVAVVAVNDVQLDQLAEFDLLVVGGPTHGSRPAPPMQEFLGRIPDGALAGIKVVAFDTRTDMDALSGASRFFGKIFDRLGYAAPKISADLEKKGGQVICPPEGFIVEGTEGPLRNGELERTAEWVQHILAVNWRENE